MTCPQDLPHYSVNGSKHPLAKSKNLCVFRYKGDQLQIWNPYFTRWQNEGVIFDPDKQEYLRYKDTWAEIDAEGLAFSNLD